MCGGLARVAEDTRRVLDQLALYHALSSLYPAAARSQHRVTMYTQWGNRLLEFFTIETCDQVAAEFAALFSVQPSRVRELRAQHVTNLNLQLEQWSQELVLSLQRTYHTMMQENIMKTGKAGTLEELGKTREMILQQLQHPDSGVTPHTLLPFYLRTLLDVATKWAELEAGLVEAVGQAGPGEEALLDSLFLQAGVLSTLLNTADMFNIGQQSVHSRALEGLAGVLGSLQQLRSSWSTIIMPEALKNFLHEEPSVLEVCLQLEEIITSGGLAIAEVKHEARLHAGCCILGVDSPHLAAMELAANMQGRYTALVQQAGTADTMSTGQMLLCAANSLFDKVETDLAGLRLLVQAAPVPEEGARLGLVQVWC